MEVGSGFHVEPCGHGSSRASSDRDFGGDPAGDRPDHAARRLGRIFVPRQPVGDGVGHVLDLGTIGSRGGIARARCGTRRPYLGRRRVAGAPEPLVAVVVIRANLLRVSVIIPTHNEAEAIGRVLADLPSNLVTEVIVVDSNSTDGTPDLARKMGAQVVQEPRRGYGRACLTGLANTHNPDVVVFLDGDYSDRPSELPILLAPIVEGRADITVGSRLSGKGNRGALPWHQSFGNRLAAGLIQLLYRVKVSDLGPFRAGRA